MKMQTCSQYWILWTSSEGLMGNFSLSFVIQKLREALEGTVMSGIKPLTHLQTLKLLVLRKSRLNLNSSIQDKQKSLKDLAKIVLTQDLHVPQL